MSSFSIELWVSFTPGATDPPSGGWNLVRQLDLTATPPPLIDPDTLRGWYIATDLEGDGFLDVFGATTFGFGGFVPWTDTGWHYLLFTYDEGTQMGQFYIDDAPAPFPNSFFDPLGALTNDGPFCIAGGFTHPWWGTVDFLSASVCRVAYYNAVLDDTTRLAHFDANLAGYDAAISATSGLVSYWPLDETSGTVANDSHGTNPGGYIGGVALAQPGPAPGVNAALFDGVTGQVLAPPPAPTHPIHYQSTADLEAEVGLAGSWSFLTSFVVAGILIERATGSNLFRVQRYAGEQNVPSDIKRVRKAALQVMRRMGQPVIVKHMFNDHDARVGLAKPSPVFNPAYGQTRNRDPLSFGTGYCSVQFSDDEWIDPSSGNIVVADGSPGPTFQRAPMYRGYGPGYLTYLIEPDVPVDLFKVSQTGALIKIQSQLVVSGWFPEINDNDLIINVTLDNDGNVADTAERYQAKITRPISIRGLDRRGRQEYSADRGNRHVVNQQFEMSLLPETSALYAVSTDR